MQLGVVARLFVVADEEGVRVALNGTIPSARVEEMVGALDALVERLEGDPSFGRGRIFATAVA